MNATITYQLLYVPHPWDAQARAQGVEVWALMKRTVPRSGAGPLEAREVAVALFNLDSEAQLLQRHLFEGGAIFIDRDVHRALSEHSSEPGLKAWLRRHDGHGVSYDGLVFLRDGEGPTRDEDWIRAPWLDGPPFLRPAYR